MLVLLIIVIVCFGGAIIINNIEHKQKRRIAQRNNPKPKTTNPINTDMIRTTYDEIKQYTENHGGKLSEIPEYVFDFENPDNTIDVPKTIFADIDEAIDARQKWEKTYNIISTHRTAGMTFESENEIDAAIDEYAAAIKIGESCGLDMFHAYRHAYERIIALLRQTSRVVTLEQYCRAYLKHPVDESTQIRINKIIQSI